MDNIILIGMSGAGKTTIGNHLSEKLNMRFYDIDDMIVEEEQKTIDDIFKIKGEDYFRELERKLVNKLSNKSNAVISTGGGVILNENNMINLNNCGIIIFLEAKIDTLMSNLEKSKVIRPLLENGKDYKQNLTKMYKNRKEKYISSSDITINVDNKSIDDITYEIINIIGSD